jgi:hypothetical protein
MRERADRIDARFSLRRGQPEGTEIEVIVPGATAYPKDMKSRWVASVLGRLRISSHR